MDEKIKSKKILFVAGCLRIIITIFILYITNIPLFLKIILIDLFDKLDCTSKTFGRGPLFIKETEICETEFYQKNDKITDSICYILLLLYIINKSKFNNSYNYLLMFLLIYRLLGVFLFLNQNNRKYLIYFPNFFTEICLFFSLINYFPILEIYKIPIILSICFIKMFFEFILHF